MTLINRALIIDDDEVNNFICIKNLRDLNFAQHASYCTRGREGLDILASAAKNHPEEFPDVIFLDINMPVMSAWEFLEEYKKIQASFPRKVYLFILSSSVYRKDIERSSQYEVVTDYIIKPLNKEKLIQIQEKYFS
ncbi:MAG: response regulator [Bacteroidia bacterium]|nr:response regulator [Bacteroidia bacterium]